jgi:hypothetical protein
LLFYQTTPSYNDLEIRVTGNQLQLTGAYDQTPSDGPGYAFDVSATAIPEPATLTLAILLLGGHWVLPRSSKGRNLIERGPRLRGVFTTGDAPLT